MKSRRKTQIGFILAVVVAVGVLFSIFHENRYKRAVEEYKQQLRAQGEKLTIAELVPLPLADTFDNAQAFMTAMNLAGNLTNNPPTMRFIVPGRAMVAWQQEILPSPLDNVPDIWPGLRLEVKANRDALTNLRVVLTAPNLQFNPDYSKGFPVLSHLVKLKKAELLMAAVSVTALHDRQYSEAWTNLLSSVVLLEHYKTEPLLISHLVRIAMAQIAIGSTWEFLQSDQWSDAQLAELQSAWQSLEFFKASEPTFLMERAVNIETFRRWRASGEELENIRNLSGSPSASQNLFDDPKEYFKGMLEKLRYKVWRRSWSYDEELYYLQKCTAGLEATRTASTSGKSAPALDGLKRDLLQINRNHTNAIAHFLIPDLFSGSEPILTSAVKFAHTETARRILVTAIALKRYQLRSGKYPPDLKALVPEFLSHVPLDLMDGQPLRYRPTSDGNYLLYSVGEDGHDNGGDPDQAEAVEAGPFGLELKYKSWLKGRDIVWPRPATAEEVATNRSPITSSKVPSQSANISAGTNTTGR